MRAVPTAGLPGDPHPRCGVCVAGILNCGKRSPTWPSCPLYPGGRIRYPPKTVVMCNRYQPGTPNNIKQPVFYLMVVSTGWFQIITLKNGCFTKCQEQMLENFVWFLCASYIPPSHLKLNASMKTRQLQTYSIRNNMKILLSSQLPLKPWEPQELLFFLFFFFSFFFAIEPQPFRPTARSVLPSKCRSPTRSRCIAITRAFNNASRISGWDRGRKTGRDNFRFFFKDALEMLKKLQAEWGVIHTFFTIFTTSSDMFLLAILAMFLF